MGQNIGPPEITDFHLLDALGVLRHILQLDGELRAAFFPQGHFDLRELTADPASPPLDRCRFYFRDGALFCIGPPPGNVVTRIGPPAIGGSGLDSGVVFSEVNDSIAVDTFTQIDGMFFTGLPAGDYEFLFTSVWELDDTNERGRLALFNDNVEVPGTERRTRDVPADAELGVAMHSTKVAVVDSTTVDVRFRVTGGAILTVRDRVYSFKGPF